MTDERAAITRAWAGRAERDQVLGRDREATLAEVAGWIELGLASADPSASAELAKLVAVSARTAGFEGTPASVIALRLEALGDAWREAGSSSFSRVSPLLRTLLRAALDAHALGTAEARDQRHLRAIREMTPVFRTRDGALVAILLGPMVPELIDATMARVLHESQAAEPARIVLDLLGAETDDARFHYTIAALLREPAAYKRTVVISGSRDIARTYEGLRAAGADLDRVRVVHRLSDALGGDREDAPG